MGDYRRHDQAPESGVGLPPQSPNGHAAKLEPASDKALQ
jgi:hypothetical protein